MTRDFYFYYLLPICIVCFRTVRYGNALGVVAFLAFTLCPHRSFDKIKCDTSRDHHTVRAATIRARVRVAQLRHCMYNPLMVPVSCCDFWGLCSGGGAVVLECQITTRTPALLSLSVENNLQPKLRFFVKELGMEPAKLRQVGGVVSAFFFWCKLLWCGCLLLLLLLLLLNGMLMHTRLV